MPIAVVTLSALPAECELAFGADHFLTTTILLNHHITVWARLCSHQHLDSIWEAIKNRYFIGQTFPD